ncbi:T6SS phospholipase effector Tle1-like catalytic domain-containing protein [Cupriavidus sp. CP313]
MSVFRLPSTMPETDTGRLPEGKRAYEFGKTTVNDVLGACEQTIHINLFFDGTNNNDDPKTRRSWRDSTYKTHTNVARLFNACPHRPLKGIFSYYMAGVGTPFPELGEHTYSSSGKAFASGFAKRCVWGYTRVLNGVHEAMTGVHGDDLIKDDDAAKICDKLDWGLSSSLLTTKEKHLGSLYESLVQQCKRNRLVKKAYINVFGFSRGAAGARVFVSKLLKDWAKNGKLADKIEYEVNFMGLFDTVASVGPPDSFRAAVDIGTFDGHFWAARGGALDIPPQVRHCVHFFSMHEQRMSFPLDSIRQGDSYPTLKRKVLEVPYPGVHSDVGGSYAPGDQGKSVKGEGHRLGKITLHEMYIEALKVGVPLYTVDAKSEEDRMPAPVLTDFTIDPAVAEAFNEWRAKLPAIDNVEKALEFGLRQSLQWRSLRARWHTGTYITNQPFYRYAAEKCEAKLTPHQLDLETERRKQNDPELLRLRKEKAELCKQAARLQAYSGQRQAIPQIMDDMKEMAAIRAKAAANEAAIAKREWDIMAEAAGKDPAERRAGEGADELVTNDRTDLLEAAEEFQLLLGFLHPEQQASLNVRKESVIRLFSLDDAGKGAATGALGGIVGAAGGSIGGAVGGTIKKSGEHLAVPRADRAKADSPNVVLVDPDALVSTAALRSYYASDDVLVKPAPEMISYLTATTAPKAVDEFSLREKAAIELFDNYIHDSRAWFRVPNFHEYALGGYGWARSFFVGGDKRIQYLGMTGSAQKRAA